LVLGEQHRAADVFARGMPGQQIGVRRTGLGDDVDAPQRAAGSREFAARGGEVKWWALHE
jgi:hypothetical protein